jgi:hypothetical protein
MASAVPLVEVTYDTDSRGVWCPDDKMDSGDTLHCSEMGPHRLVGFVEGPLGKKMQLKVCEERWEGIGIMSFYYLPCIVGYKKPVEVGFKGTRYGSLEETIHRKWDGPRKKEEKAVNQSLCHKSLV